MSILPDYRIEAEHEVLGIEPFDPERVQPASYDLTLDNHFRRFTAGHNGRTRLVDPKDPEDHTVPYVMDKIGLEPHGFLLASTVEKVSLPDNVVAQVEGKSSLARLGLFVHVTAGWIDPGFSGHITLELFCANPRGIWLYAGMPVAQISFELMESAAKRPYGHGAHGSKYANQPRGPQPSLYWKNFVVDDPSDLAPAVEEATPESPAPSTLFTLPNGHRATHPLHTP